MKYIFLHGLGQTSSSWDKVIDNLDFKDDILCPNLSKWTKNKETCYHTLYTETTVVKLENLYAFVDCH